MQKIIAIISIILIVGCNNSSTGDNVNPLVGTWEATEMKVTMEGMEMSMDVGPGTDMGSMTYTFNADGTLNMTTIDEEGTENASGSWSTTGNKLTIIDEEDSESIEFDYSLTGNTLVLSGLITEDSMTMDMELIFEKQ